jgi:hypothetical protein
MRFRTAIIRPVDPLTRLYRQFDPLRPLEADEADLYVDWQKQIGPEDIKKRLVNSIAFSAGIPVTRLFTGHRGVGKTTELKRVKRILESGQARRKIFVSLLEAEESLDLQDVSAPDVVFHMARQLVWDLRAAGFDFGWTKLTQFFKEFGELLRSEVELKNVEVGADPIRFGVVLKDVPRARPALRRLLEERLPNIYDLVNEEILRPAREYLQKNGGFDDILLAVDQLDRIPQKIVNDRGLTNHENLFLDNAGILRALACDVLYTLPIELAYSLRRVNLQTTYGTDILALPVIPVRQRGGEPSEQGLGVLRQIVGARTAKAGLRPDEVFAEPELLDRFCLLSGGHFRTLFVLLRAALERCDQLPITGDLAELAVRRAANDLSLPLRAREWQALEQIHRTKAPLEKPEDAGLWYDLLRGLYVFTYEDGAGLWYDWNPLLGEVPQGARR